MIIISVFWWICSICLESQIWHQDSGYLCFHLMTSCTSLTDIHEVPSKILWYPHPTSSETWCLRPDIRGKPILLARLQSISPTKKQHFISQAQELSIIKCHALLPVQKADRCLLDWSCRNAWLHLYIERSPPVPPACYVKRWKLELKLSRLPTG